MNYTRLILFGLALFLAGANFGCTDRGPDGPPASPDNGSDSSRKGEGAITDPARPKGTVEPDDLDQVTVQPVLGGDVFFKPKGAGDFVRIVVDVAFSSGDTLKVGQSSKALVFCKDVCELDAGEYTQCCTGSCRVVVNLEPPDSERKFFMKKADLPPEQARMLEERESQIANLSLAKVKTQLLRASLYSSWKLTESTGEVEALDQELDKPEAKAQLGQGYATAMLRTGDLLRQIDLKDKAAARYKKTIALDPDPATRPDRVDVEKAAAHRRLADINIESGNKNEASENLNSAKQIYVRRGDIDKAREIDKKRIMTKVP
jgi:hypothetical protein